MSEIIKRRKLTQVQAADLRSITQPKLSGLLRGQFRDIYETKVLDGLTRLGRDIQIVVESVPRSRTGGYVPVVFA